MYLLNRNYDTLSDLLLFIRIKKTINIIKLLIFLIKILINIIDWNYNIFTNGNQWPNKIENYL